MKLFATFLLSCVALSFAQAQTTWHKIPSGTNSQLNCISFADAQTAFIGGNDSTLLKSVDGGKTWNRVALNLSFSTQFIDVIDIEFLDTLNGYLLVGPYGDVYRTSNGGASWVADGLNQTNMCFKQSIYFFDADNGFAGGSMCFQGETIAQKVNGNWDTLQTVGGWDANDQVSGFDFVNSQVGLACSTGGYVFRTTNGGASWDSINTGFDTLNLSDIQYQTDSIVYATYTNTGLEGLLESTDGGLTWARNFSAATFHYPGLFAMTKDANNTIYFGGKNQWGAMGAILQAGPLGFSVYLAEQEVYGITSPYDTIVFAVGDSGYIATNVLPSSIGIQENKSIKVNVYPNPVKDQFSINGLRKSSRIEMYTISGQLVYRSQTSSEKETIDIGLLKPGMYILNIQSNNQVESLKILKE